MSLLDAVHRTLEAAGVPHALVGAAALASLGIARSTFDVDLLVTDRRCLDETFWAGLRQGETTVNVRRGDLDDPLAGVVRVDRAGDRPVDIIVGRHAWQARALDRSAPQSEGPAIVLAPDLVLLKLFAGGTQDLWDVEQLLALPEGASLAAAVAGDIAVLPPEARARWARLLDART